MKKAAIYLTNYVIHNGKADENERPIYEYGFQVALETLLTFSVCTILAASMHMLIEEFIFFTIFIPLRSYGGGFHFDRYVFCFLFSCFAFTCTLYISRLLALPQAAFCSIPVLLLCIHLLHPAEHINRSIDEAEKIYFKSRLDRFLMLDFILFVFFFYWNQVQPLSLMLSTIILNLFSMMIGKILYNLRSTYKKKNKKK